MKVRTLTITYDNILSIYATKIPLLGVCRVRVVAKGVRVPIKVPCFFCRSRDMFRDFYNICREKKPAIHFDDCLEEFAARDK